jgi:hypothetical protein
MSAIVKKVYSWKIKLSFKEQKKLLKNKFPDKTSCWVHSQIAIVIKMTKVKFWAASKKKSATSFVRMFFFLEIEARI